MSVKRVEYKIKAKTSKNIRKINISNYTGGPNSNKFFFFFKSEMMETSRIREGTVKAIIIASMYWALTMCQSLFSMLSMCSFILAPNCTMNKVLLLSSLLNR